MTESIVDFNNDKEFPIATMFYCPKITGLQKMYSLINIDISIEVRSTTTQYDCQ